MDTCSHINTNGYCVLKIKNKNNRIRNGNKINHNIIYKDYQIYDQQFVNNIEPIPMNMLRINSLKKAKWFILMATITDTGNNFPCSNISANI